jgi:hypothetical protein
MILAIDPGTTESGWATLTTEGKILCHGVEPNDKLLADLFLYNDHTDYALAIEMVASYGMPVGREVFETCVWIGRFVQRWRAPEEVRLVYRRDVKLHLCGSPKAKDANIRQALIDRFGPIGTKKDPGPLYGVKSHAWAALAVAVTVFDNPLKTA